MNFEEVYKQYLKYIDCRLKPQSKEDLKVKFENKILPYFKDYNIYEITDLDFINWQSEISKYDYSNSYLKHIFYVFSGFLNYCVKYHNLPYNFATKVGNFKMKNVIVKTDFYTLKEFRSFIKYVQDPVMKAFFNTLFFYGIRPGEAMAFQFSDLDDKRKLKVSHTISEHTIDGVRVITDPKTKHSVRSFSLSKKDYKMLVSLKELYINRFGECNDDYFIFGGIKPLAPTTINRHKLKACRKANLRPLELRGFRRSNASLLYNFNVPLQIIKERLGHASITTTSKYYIHVYDNKEKRVTRTLNFIRLFF